MRETKTTDLAVVGCGTMGAALARILVKGAFEPNKGALLRLFLCDADASRADALAKDLLGEASSKEIEVTVTSAPLTASVVLLCVKPQVLPEVARLWAESAAGALVISIAAGVTLATLEELLPSSRVVRVMPNLALVSGCGASAIALGERASDSDAKFALELFSEAGEAALMSEEQLDVMGALSGCGPAYLALFVDALTRPAVLAGLSADVSRRFIEATFEGTARLLLTSKIHPRALMDAVMSPGGTTVRAVSAMESLLMEGAATGVEAALQRTRELAVKGA